MAIAASQLVEVAGIPEMTAVLRQFSERMQMQTRRGTHTEFMNSLSPSEARAYLEAFDRWLVRKNPQATDQDYYWPVHADEILLPRPATGTSRPRTRVALDPGNVDIWVSLGHLAAGRKQWSQAIEYYEAGIKAEPRNFFPWYGRAMAYMELRRFDHSLRDIHRAIEIHPNLAYGYETRGRIFSRGWENLEKAVADLDFAVQYHARQRPKRSGFPRRVADEASAEGKPPRPIVRGKIER